MQGPRLKCPLSSIGLKRLARVTIPFLLFKVGFYSVIQEKRLVLTVVCALLVGCVFFQRCSAQVVLEAAPAKPSGLILGAEPSVESEKLTVRSTPQLVVDTGAFNSQIRALALSAKGEFVFASTDTEIRIWDVDTGELKHTIHCFRRGESGMITSMAVDPSDTTLVIGVRTNHGSYLKTCQLDALDSTEGLWGDPEDLDQLGNGVSFGSRSARQLTFTGDGRLLTFVATGLVAKDGQYTEQVTYVNFDWRNRKFNEAVIAPEAEVDDELEEFFGTPWVPQGGQYYGSNRFYVLPLFHSAYDEEQKKEVDIDAHPELQWYDRFTDRYQSYHAGDDSFSLFGHRGSITARKMAMAYLSKKNGHDVYSCEIYSGESDRPTARYDGLSWGTSDITMSHDASRVALGDGSGVVHVISSDTGKLLFRSRSNSRSTYAASLDQGSGVLAFGQQPNSGANWKVNDYASLTQGFDLRKRRYVKRPSGNFPRARVTEGNLSGRSSRNNAGKFVSVSVANQVAYSTQPINQPLFSFALAKGNRPGETLLFQGYSAMCKVDAINAASGKPVQGATIAFASDGNGSVASDINLTADGKFVTVAWTDGTVCVYRKSDFAKRQLGGLPFDAQIPETIQSLVKGISISKISSPQQSGDLQVGDRVVTLNGQAAPLFLQSYIHNLSGNNSGDSVDIQYIRGDQLRNTTIQLTQSPLQGLSNVQPVLTFFKTRKDDWILFTPEGYYDASPGGHDLIGWNVNRGPDESADYFTAHQLRKTLYRPDVIEQVIDAILGGRSEAASAQTSAASVGGSNRTSPVDLREQQSFQNVLPPAISVTGIPSGGIVATEQVKLTVTATPQSNVPVKSIVILVDGRPASANTARPAKHADGSMTLTQTIDVPVGESSISVIATNRSASSTPKTITLTRKGQPAASSKKPRMLLLAIGVSDYLNDDYDLQFSAIDAIDFNKALKAQQGKFYREVESKVLTDKQATRSGIQDGMDWLYERVEPDDIAVIFISGHGVYDPRNNFYFANYETDVKRLRSTALAYTEIESAIKDMPCKILLFADTCHAGAARGFGAIRDPWTDLVSGEIGAILFASSTPREESQESDEWGHGAFTYALLESLKQRKTDVTGDGMISLTELELSIGEKVRLLTDDQQHPTTQKPGTIPNFNIAVSGTE